MRSASPSTEFFKPPPQRRSDIFTALQPWSFRLQFCFHGSPIPSSSAVAGFPRLPLSTPEASPGSRSGSIMPSEPCWHSSPSRDLPSKLGSGLRPSTRLPRRAFPSLWLLFPSLPASSSGSWPHPTCDSAYCHLDSHRHPRLLGSFLLLPDTPQPAPGLHSPLFSLLLLWCLISISWQQPYLALLSVHALPPLPNPDLVVRQTRSGCPSTSLLIPVLGCFSALHPLFR